jgi:hypothetical protein
VRRLSLTAAHHAVLDLVRYVDQDVADWLGKSSRVPSVLAARP